MSTPILLNEKKTKTLLREALIELMEERPSEFRQLIIEAMEEVALANAIREGRKDDFVSEKEVIEALRG